MHEYKEIDFESWPRKKVFEHFKAFDSPRFNLTCKINVKKLCDFAKERGESLFLLTLYALLRAANKIPEMRQRELDGKIVEFERIGALTPIMPEGERQFVEIRCDYKADFESFKGECAPLIESVKKGNPPPATKYFEDLVCATCNPWFHFESASFAFCNFHQSMPLFAWGKIQDSLMPLTLCGNHCFIDGIHIGEFYNLLQVLCDNPANLYK